MQPPVKKTEIDNAEEFDDDDDEDVSSGEEEEGVHVQEVAVGKVKLMKLTFDDVCTKLRLYLCAVCLFWHLQFVGRGEKEGTHL